MVDVLLTIDTEAWPLSPDWRQTRLSRDIARDIYGSTRSGAFGVGYLIDVMNRYRIKAVFFLETMFSLAAGLEPLKRLVRLIEDRGHEVQLHLHTEWLKWLEPSPLPGRTGANLKDFSVDEQASLIDLGIRQLRDAGVKQIRAFRAGNYGANFDTLRALARNGIQYDCSHNACFLNSVCGMRAAGRLLGPAVVHDVCVVPVSFFEDFPGHHRHTQVCACSSAELEHALTQAWHTGKPSFVIVCHSFELIRDRSHRKGLVRPDQTVVRRFERLCQFLGQNRDKFRTRGFNEMNGHVMEPGAAARPLRSGIHRTAWRIAEQLMRRMV